MDARVEGWQYGDVDDEELMVTTTFFWRGSKRSLILFEGDKAPGPDGFNMALFERCWQIVENDMMKTQEFFYQEGTSERSFNTDDCIDELEGML